jgi:hypothetical protein
VVSVRGYKSWFLQIMQETRSVGCGCGCGPEAETRSTPEAARLRAAGSVDEWEYEMSMSEGRRGRPCMSQTLPTGDRSSLVSSCLYLAFAQAPGGVGV